MEEIVLFFLLSVCVDILLWNRRHIGRLQHFWFATARSEAPTMFLCCAWCNCGHSVEFQLSEGFWDVSKVHIMVVPAKRRWSWRQDMYLLWSLFVRQLTQGDMTQLFTSSSFLLISFLYRTLIFLYPIKIYHQSVHVSLDAPWWLSTSHKKHTKIDIIQIFHY